MAISYEKLWKIVERRGWTRKDVVRLAGISESTCRKLLNDDSVRIEVLAKICVALSVDIGDICSVRADDRDADYRAQFSRNGSRIEWLE